MDRYFEDILGRTDVTYRAEFMSKEDVLKEKIYSLEKQLAEERTKIKEVKLPKHYIINENATILFWDNGEKTIVKKCAEDEFNPRLAFLTAFFQHYVDMSKNKANKYLASLQIEKPKQEPKHLSKFKVGNKVEIIKGDHYSKRNWKGIISLIDNNDDTFLVDYDNGKSWWVNESQIKLIEEDK